MKKSKKIACVFLALMLVVTMTDRIKVEAKKKPELNRKKLTLYVGKSAKLKVKYTKRKVKWYSSKKSIVMVSKKGKVTAKKKGKAKIIAQIGKKKLICKIVIKAKKSSKKNPVAETSKPTPTIAPTVAPSVEPTATMIPSDIDSLSDKPAFLGFKDYEGADLQGSSISVSKLNSLYNTPVIENQINEKEMLLLKLSYINKRRDSIVEIIINDSDYGQQQIYTTAASVNKIVSSDTYYDSEEESYVTDVLLKMPVTKSNDTRTVEIVETTFLRETVGRKGCADMSFARTKSVCFNVSKTPLPSYPVYFNFSKNDTGYAVISLSTVYELPSCLYIPPTYNGEPVTQIGNECFDKSTISKLVIPSSIQTIGDNIFNNTASNLDTIILCGDTAPILNGDMGISSDTSIFIPENTYPNYISADTGWMRYKDCLWYKLNGKKVQYINSINCSDSMMISEGKESVLTVNISPANAESANITFLSSDTGIVSVDENGLCKGVSPGRATIMVQADDGHVSLSKNISVTVTADVLSSTSIFQYPLTEDFEDDSYNVWWSTWNYSTNWFDLLTNTSVCSANKFITDGDNTYFYGGSDRLNYGVNTVLDNRNSEKPAVFNVTLKVRGREGTTVGINNGAIYVPSGSLYYYDGGKGRDPWNFYNSIQLTNSEWETLSASITIPANKIGFAGIRVKGSSIAVDDFYIAKEVSE